MKFVKSKNGDLVNLEHVEAICSETLMDDVGEYGEVKAYMADRLDSHVLMSGKPEHCYDYMQWLWEEFKKDGLTQRMPSTAYPEGE